MTTPVAFQIPYDRKAAISNQVKAGFIGYIGNEEAVYAIERDLLMALATEPPKLTRAFLLWGPSSAGKTEMARRIAGVMGLPFSSFAGATMKNVKQLVVTMERAAASYGLPMRQVGERGGMPIFKVPAMLVFVDEAHDMKESVQETFLTLIESKDRTAVIEIDREMRVYDVSDVGFIFATTHPHLLIRTFRNRCTEIALRSYTAGEVAEMVSNAYPDLPADVINDIATCCKCIPRKALDFARDVVAESATRDNPNLRECFARVARGRGILGKNGTTRNDVHVLRVLAKLNGSSAKPRPAGAGLIAAQCQDIDRVEIRDEIEPFLLRQGFITSTERGRLITMKGRMVLDEFEGEE